MDDSVRPERARPLTMMAKLVHRERDPDRERETRRRDADEELRNRVARFLRERDGRVLD